MRNTNQIEANELDKCSCCNRNHRKLTFVDGFVLGANCLEDYKLFKKNSDVKSIYWVGYETKHRKIQTMIGK
jgi:hypothetical protein